VVDFLIIKFNNRYFYNLSMCILAHISVTLYVSEILLATLNPLLESFHFIE
jgi:hypothetical protein